MSLNPTIAVPNSLTTANTASNGAAELARYLLGKEVTRFFLQRYIAVTVLLFGIGSIVLFQLATPAFRSACYFGMALPVLASFVSFLVCEWAYEQPSSIFLVVSLGSMVLRMFNLLLAFTVGLLILKMSVFGLIVGLLGSYLTYLIIEISYIHKKGSLDGQ